MASTSVSSGRRSVPVGTIAAAIGMVLLTALALLLLLYKVSTVLVWLVVAAFFTIALNPVVNWVQRRITGGRRTLATLLVFLVVVVLIAGLLTLFAVPLAREGVKFAAQFPQLLNDAKSGRGVVGRLLNRTHALTYIQQHQDKVPGRSRPGSPRLQPAPSKAWPPASPASSPCSCSPCLWSSKPPR